MDSPTAAALPVVPFHGLRLTCPFSRHFRRHTDRELAALSDSIRALGFLRDEPIRLYKDTTLEIDDCVLDGEGRLAAVLSSGLPLDDVELQHVGELTTDQAYDRACALNDARRQDDPDAVEARRVERLERHARMHRLAQGREEGKSIRTLAEEEGISKSQVERDLADAGATVPGGTVQGRDGKERPSSMPRQPSPPPPEPPTPVYTPVVMPAQPVPPPLPKAATKLTFDWGPLEAWLADGRALLAAAMAKLRIAGGTYHREGAALLDDFERLILSDKKADLSAKYRQTHGG